MIDWWLVSSSALWILGLSVLLAAFSYHHWLVQETGSRLRDQFKTRACALPFWLGMTLVFVGIAASRHADWWERLLWGTLAINFAWQLARRVRKPST